MSLYYEPTKPSIHIRTISCLYFFGPSQILFFKLTHEMMSANLTHAVDAAVKQVTDVIETVSVIQYINIFETTTYFETVYEDFTIFNTITTTITETEVAHATETQMHTTMATETSTTINTSVTNVVNKALLIALLVMIVLLLIFVGCAIGLWLYKRKPQGYGTRYRIRDDTNLQKNDPGRARDGRTVSYPNPQVGGNTHGIEMASAPPVSRPQSQQPGPSRPVTQFKIPGIPDPSEFEDVDLKSGPPSYRTDADKPGYF